MTETICVTTAKMHMKAVKNQSVIVAKMVVATIRRKGRRMSMTENKQKRVSVRQLAARTIKELKEEVAYYKENVPLLLSENERLKCQVQQFEAIGTVEEFKALKEKSMAKKPIRSDLCTCPSCGTHNDVIKKRRNTVAFDTVYCWHCGQAMEVRREKRDNG